MKLFKTALCFIGIFQGISNAQSSNATLSVSQDGSCGATVNQTCQGSSYGDCCSARGYCGGTTDYCTPSNDCQSAFGTCSTSSSVISVDGRCGTQDPLHQICIGSEFGSCCSTNGWCGNTTTYCGQGCQSSSGTCGGDGVTINTGSNSTSASSSVSNTSSSPTHTSSAASSTSSSSSDTSAASSSELASTKSSLKATQAGLGVVAAFLAIALIVIVWLVFFRRKRSKNTHEVEHLEKASDEVEPTPKHSSHAPTSPADVMSAVSEAPPAPMYQSIDNKWSTSKFEAHELGSTDSRAELRGSETGPVY